MDMAPFGQVSTPLGCRDAETPTISGNAAEPVSLAIIGVMGNAGSRLVHVCLTHLDGGPKHGNIRATQHLEAGQHHRNRRALTDGHSSKMFN